MENKSRVLGIAGGTGSGKTTIAEQVARSLGSQAALIIPQDSYYRDLGELSPAERAGVNFDHPDAFDWELLKEQLQCLRAGRHIEKPLYDFCSHTRRAETERVEPHPWIILEGILIFHDPELREAMDVRIFVDTDADIRLLRRLERDIRERGRSLESVVRQYLATVRPMHLAFVESGRAHADLIVPGGGRNRVAQDLITAYLKSQR